MSRSAETKAVFGSTSRQVHATRRRMVAFLKEKGITYPSFPSNAVLYGRAKQEGWSPATKVNGPLKKQKDFFYESREWRSLRYEALKANNGRCELCGSGKHSGSILHVDHIKPRSLHPELELEASNLQVLCEDCNVGKSNKDMTDWRTPEL